MAPTGLKGRLGKNADVSKNNINIISLYRHKKKQTSSTETFFFIANYIPSPVFEGF